MAARPNTTHDAPLLLSTASFALHGAIANPSIAMDAILSLSQTLDGIDLFILCDDSGDIPPLSVPFMDWLSSYETVTIHTSFAEYETPNGVDHGKLVKALRSLKTLMKGAGANDITIHADSLLGSYSNKTMDIIVESLPDNSVCLEMMDMTKLFGNRAGHFESILGRYPHLGMTLDLAHLDELRNVATPCDTFNHPLFEGIIRYVHGSMAGLRLEKALQRQWYGRDDICHVPCVLGDTARCHEFAKLGSDYTLIMEGAVPPGTAGLKLLDEEIAWWKTLRSEL